MEADLEPMLPPEPRAAVAVPFWVWALVVGLGAVSAYSGYTALSAHQLYQEGEHIRADLAQQRDRLKANTADLTRQVEQANRARDEVENALKQSRANTEAASSQIGDLQKQVGDLQRQTSELQQQASELERAKEVAEAAARSAKETAEKEVVALKAQLAATQKKLNQALADLKKEREQVSPVPVGPAPGAPAAGAPPPAR